MTPSNNISVLPWYTDISLQNHRRSYSYGRVYPLTTHVNELPPGQIIRPHTGKAVTNVSIYDMAGNLEADVTDRLKAQGMTVREFPEYGYDVIVIPSAYNDPDDPSQAPEDTPIMTEGRHYAVLTDGEYTWYSDVFTGAETLRGYILIEWWDDSDLTFDGGRVVYTSPRFHNRLFACAEIARPEYTFEDEGETRDGYFFPAKRISEKVYRFSMLAPEYLCDVMRTIRLADHVAIRDQYQRVFHCDSILITPKWLDGDLATVEVEFQTDTIIKKIG